MYKVHNMKHLLVKYILFVVCVVIMGACKERNIAIRMMHGIDPEATCEAEFQSETYHTAICTLSTRQKVHVEAGPDVKDPKGNIVGWNAVVIYNPPPIPGTPEATRMSTPPPAPHQPLDNVAPPVAPVLHAPEPVPTPISVPPSPAPVSTPAPSAKK
jgi:hypothetical protein